MKYFITVVALFFSSLAFADGEARPVRFRVSVANYKVNQTVPGRVRTPLVGWVCETDGPTLHTSSASPGSPAKMYLSSNLTCAYGGGQFLTRIQCGLTSADDFDHRLIQLMDSQNNEATILFMCGNIIN
jgi:hypothetical protein